MKHRINPLVDCVFKAILGSRENEDVLIHFLNAVLDPPPECRITAVTLLNPYNEREFLTDKLTIVDVKATDQRGETHHIEVQLSTPTYLIPRMLLVWAKVYGHQLGKGEPFTQLAPVTSIWVLDKDLFPDEGVETADCGPAARRPPYHHRFEFYDTEHRRSLSDHAVIHTIELKKWKDGAITDDIDQWCWFLSQGERLDPDRLPRPISDNPIMGKVMKTVKQFSESDKNYFRYQARLDAIREKRTQELLWEKAQQEREEALREKDEARRNEEKALREKEAAENKAMAAEKKAKAAQKEVERLKAQLATQG